MTWCDAYAKLHEGVNRKCKSFQKLMARRKKFENLVTRVQVTGRIKKASW